MLEKIYRRKKYQTGRPLPKIDDDGKSWLRRPKLYKGVVETYKKKICSSHSATAGNTSLLDYDNDA